MRLIEPGTLVRYRNAQWGWTCICRVNRGNECDVLLSPLTNLSGVPQDHVDSLKREDGGFWVCRQYRYEDELVHLVEPLEPLSPLAEASFIVSLQQTFERVR